MIEFAAIVGCGLILASGFVCGAIVRAWRDRATYERYVAICERCVAGETYDADAFGVNPFAWVRPDHMSYLCEYDDLYQRYTIALTAWLRMTGKMR